MILHSAIAAPHGITRLIKKGDITLGGNKQLKIYGTLRCTSGNRMKLVNRVFFKDEKEVMDAGYRPCGHCMREKYIAWKVASANL